MRSIEHFAQYANLPNAVDRSFGDINIIMVFYRSIKISTNIFTFTAVNKLYSRRLQFCNYYSRTMSETEIEITTTFTPNTSEIDFLTRMINEESKAQNIKEEAYPFGIFIRNKKAATPEKDVLIGGCNGSVVYGSIYTDQLWVSPEHRGKGYGKLLMERVHQLGQTKNCKTATVGTMSFQGTQSFYESLGYQVEFVREGYTNESRMIYLKKTLFP